MSSLQSSLGINVVAYDNATNIFNIIITKEKELEKKTKDVGDKIKDQDRNWGKIKTSIRTTSFAISHVIMVGMLLKTTWEKLATSGDALTKTKGEISTITGTLSGKEESLAEAIRIAGGTAEELGAKLADLKARHEGSSVALSAYSTEIESNDTKIAANKAQIEAIITAWQQGKISTDDARKAIGGLNIENDNLTARNVLLKGGLSALIATYGEYSPEVKAAREEIASNEKQLATYKTQLMGVDEAVKAGIITEEEGRLKKAELTAAISNIETEIGKYKTEIEAVDEAVKAGTMTEEEGKIKKGELMSKIDELETKSRDYKVELMGVDNAVKGGIISEEAGRLKKDELLKKVGELETKNSTLKGGITATKDEFDKETTKVGELKDAYELVKSKSDEVKDKQEELRKKIEEAKDEEEKQKSAWGDFAISTVPTVLMAAAGITGLLDTLGKPGGLLAKVITKMGGVKSAGLQAAIGIAAFVGGFELGKTLLEAIPEKYRGLAAAFMVVAGALVAAAVAWYAFHTAMTLGVALVAIAIGAVGLGLAAAGLLELMKTVGVEPTPIEEEEVPEEQMGGTIPRTGIYKLHHGEEVVPAGERALLTRRGVGGNRIVEINSPLIEIHGYASKGMARELSKLIREDLRLRQ